MVFKFEHKAYKNESKNVQKIERKIKLEKVDKDLYMAVVQTNTEQLQNQLTNSELILEAVVSKNMSTAEEFCCRKLIRKTQLQRKTKIKSMDNRN